MSMSNQDSYFGLHEVDNSNVTGSFREFKVVHIIFATFFLLLSWSTGKLSISPQPSRVLRDWSLF